MEKAKLAVLGTGAWGTTLGMLASKNGYQIKCWSHRRGPALTEVVKDVDLIISAISVKGVRPVVEQLLAENLSSKTILVTTTKGLDPQTTNTPSQIWQQAFPDFPIVVLAGPNLAKELQQGLPGATVVASSVMAAAISVQEVFSSNTFRVYSNPDPLGVELGGTLKNVMAIAAGVCDGLNLGTNAKAALLTRGLTEMIRIGITWGAQRETFYGLSGLGDLLATCNSPLSRNYQVGYQLGRGKTLPEILAELEGTAEGVNTTAVLIQRAKEQNIYTPISYLVYRLLKTEISAQEAVEALMLRDTKPEYIEDCLL